MTKLKHGSNKKTMGETVLDSLDKLQRTDHDTLIRLEGKVDSFLTQYLSDMKELKDGTTAKINDHEVRIKTLEKVNESIASSEGNRVEIMWQERHDTKLTKKLTYGAIAAVGGVIVWILQLLSGFIGEFFFRK